MIQRSNWKSSIFTALLAGTLLAAPAALRAEEHGPSGEKPKPGAAAAGDADGPRRRPRAGAGEMFGWGRPTPEQTEELIAILKEIQPDRMQSIDALQKQDPERVNDIIREYAPKLIELAYLKRHDPEMFKLRVQDYKIARTSAEISRQLKKAKEDKDAAKTKELETQLHAKVDEHFTIRQQIRERDLAKLEKQVADLRAKYEATKKNKQEMIEQRYKELTGEAERMEW